MPVPVPLLRPPTGVRTLTFSGGVQVDTPNGVTATVARQARTQGDGLSVPGGYGVWPAATNLVINGGFETNTTGWIAGFSTEVISRVTTRSKFGAASGLCTVTTLGQAGAAWGVSTGGAAVSVGTTYTGSVYGYLNSGTPTGNFRAAIAWWTAGGAFISRSDGTAAALTAAWQRFTVTAVAPATAAFASVILFRDDTTVESFSFNIDGAQFEAGPIATPYIETDGGTASRTAGRPQLPVAGLVTATQGWVAGAVTFGWAGTRPAGSINALFSWITDTPNRILMYWSADTTLSLLRSTGGQADKSVTPTLGGSSVLIGAWTPTTTGVAAGGSALTTAANTTIPTITQASIDIGNQAVQVVGREAASTFHWLLVGNGTLGTADSVLMNSWGNTVPMLNQIAMLSPGSQPTCLMPCGTADAILLPAYFGGA